MSWLKSIFFLLTISSVDSLAAGAAKHSDGVAFLFKAINFAVLFAFLFVVIKKVVPGFLSDRSKKVADKILAAQEKDRLAKARLEEIEDKFNHLDDEMQSLKNEIRNRAEQEAKKIMDRAKSDAKHMVSSAHQSAKRLEERMIQDYKEQVAALAFEQAESKIKEAFAQGSSQAPTLQKNWVDRFSSEVNPVE